MTIATTISPERPAMTTRPTPEIRGLDQLLTLPDNGQYMPVLMQDNEDLLQDISDFSQAYGTKAKGKITIEIEYSTDRFGQVEIAASHTVRSPKPPKSKATAWRADSGGLTVANPNQRAMEIREVAGRRELRSPGDN